MALNQLFDRGTMNAPWGLESRLKLVALACRFFDAAKIAGSYAAIEKKLPSGGNLESLTVNDFLVWCPVNRFT